MRHLVSLVAALFAASVLLGGASPAHAAVVTATTDCQALPKSGDLDCTNRVIYAAGAGERNNVRVSREETDAVLRDGRAPLIAGNGCRQDTASRVVCPTRPSPADLEGGADVVEVDVQARLDLGDLDDVAEADPQDGYGSTTEVDGGPGDDRLVSVVASYAGRVHPVFVDLIAGRGGETGEEDVLIDNYGAVGGAGDDRVIGRTTDDFPWSNLLSGGAGDDRLVGGLYEDRIDAGPGNDVVEGRSGFAIDTFADDLLTGGSGDDLLIGGDASDDIHGGPGKDHILARGGDDELIHGGAGHDVLDLGAGADIGLGDGGADRIDAGAGDDHATGGSGDDRLAGGGGRDLLFGRAGDDELAGGRGSDRLYASDMRGSPGGTDRLDGGGGRDGACLEVRDRARAVERAYRGSCGPMSFGRIGR